MAYSVTEAAGIHWLTPSIWYKERTQVNAAQARELLAQGKKDGTFEEPIPEDDKKAIEKAEELVEMAETAWAQHVRGPEVEILLKMAANFAEGGEAPSEEQAPEEEPEAETPEPQQEEDSPDDGGDAPQAEGELVEPWEGYDSEKVSDIITGINNGAKEYSQADFVELMSDVWTYEAAKKGRKTILDHLEAIAKKLQSGESLTEEEKPDEAPVEEPQAEEPAADEAPEEVEGQPDGGDDPAEGDQGDADEQQPEEEAPTEDAPEAPVEEEKPKRQRRQRRKPPEDQEQQEEQGEDDLDEYEKLIRKVEADLERERVHKPPKPEDESPDLPWDWTKMTDKELQRFYGIYTAIAYYKGYQLAKEERMALHCKQAADELHNAILVALEKYDEHGKEKKVALIEAEVEQDENVITWRRRQRKHETFAAHHRNERDSLGKVIEALSRLETMRQQEWERAGKLNRQK